MSLPVKTCPKCRRTHNMTSTNICSRCRNGERLPKCPYKLIEQPRAETWEWEDPEHEAEYLKIKRVPVDPAPVWEPLMIAVADIPTRRGKRR